VIATLLRFCLFRTWLFPRGADHPTRRT
jgi:hypothetical protein